VKTCISTVISILIALMFSSLAMKAQSEASRLSGDVLDQSGSAVVGAKVLVRNLATGATYVVDSDKSGHFAFEGMPEGKYVITANANGFQALTRSGIAITHGQDVTANLELKVANRRETVTVIETSGYVVPEVSTVSKLALPVTEIPLSVQVVPAGVIQDQLALRLPDITRNVSGVQTNFGYGALYEAFALRGFETNVTLRNGERVSGGIGRSSVDIANVEDVEVLKGPAAMIYGRLEPGGMINVVTKKPLASHRYSLEQEFGSYDLYRTTLDATGPITSDSLLYRGIFSFFDANQFITYAPHGRTYFAAPSLSWRPTNKLILNTNVEYRNMDPLIANGIPAIGNRPADVSDHALPRGRRRGPRQCETQASRLQWLISVERKLEYPWRGRKRMG